MKIKCPQCQKVFSAPDTYIGKKVKCLKCNHLFIANPPIDKQEDESRMHLLPFVLLGTVLLMLIGAFFYISGHSFKLSQKNVLVSDSNNISSIKSTSSVNSLDKQSIGQDVKIERKTEKTEKTTQDLGTDTNFAIAEADAVEHKETIPISNPVMDNNSCSTDEFKMLPTLYSVLDDKVCFLGNKITWLTWSISLEVIAKGGTTEQNPDEHLIKKDNVIEMINSSGNSLISSYRKEIRDLIKNSDFVFLKSIGEDQLPIKFASIENKPIIIMGTICSDTIFNNVNTLLNTPKKRASAFIQKNIFPELLAKDIFNSICNTPFEYIGLVYIYGNRNFIKDETLSYPEDLCIVIPLKDYSSFMKRELSQEEFLKKCFVFLRSEGSNFIKVELVLD